MTRTALAIRHVHFEDVGGYADALAAAGYALTYREAGLDDLAAIDAEAPSLLIVLGGPMGVYQEAEYPCLGDTLRLLERRLAADLPTLGICLGAQLMARALGAQVAPGPRPEIGWAPLTLTDASAAGPLRHFDGVPVLHWHGDVADLPDDAERLAFTEVCPNQAFSRGRRQLGLQFHGEVPPAAIERWLIGHAHEIGAVPSVSVEKLRGQARRHGAASLTAGRACIAEWLDGLSS